ncbi:MAG: OsmC family protein [Microscillaceae bacterium]|nr:OsmC family protein [Microscillaceae bacterium]
MNYKTKTVWNEGYHFTTSFDHRETHFDAVELAKNPQGVSPKTMLLSSLAGCTGMDVVALLGKYKVPFSDFDLEVSGEVTDTHPKYFHKIHVIYQIKVAEEHREKVEEAIQLSREKYCGVQAMLNKAAEITHEIKYL